MIAFFPNINNNFILNLPFVFVDVSNVCVLIVLNEPFQFQLDESIIMMKGPKFLSGNIL